MLKQIDSTQWSLGDLTGGSCLFESANGTFYTISTVRSDNTIAVLKSTDYGVTWAALTSYTFPNPTAISEPQLVYDSSNGVAYIITTADNIDGSNSLLAFKYTLSGNVLSVPVTIVTGQRVKSAYAIALDTAVNEVIVLASVTSPSAPSQFLNQFAVVEVVLNSSLTVLRDTVLSASPLRTGDTYGSVSLAVRSGVVDAYWVQHPRQYKFQPRVSFLNTKSRTSAGSWGSTNELNHYQSEFNDDKFTVYQDTVGNRYLLHIWYTVTQVPHGTYMAPRIESTLLLGYKPVAGTWSFTPMKGGSKSISEPTLSLNSNGVVLAYLLKDMNTEESGGLQMFDWDPANNTILPISSRLNGQRFSWLRGSTSYVDTSTKFSFVGMVRGTTSTTAKFISSTNLAPVPAFTANTFTLTRGVTYTLDASATQDADIDDLIYTWTLTQANSNITLTPIDGGYAKVRVANSVGPSLLSFDVNLQVQDRDITGTILHTTNVVHTFTVPVKIPPEVYWYDYPVQALRNQEVTLSPMVWDPNGSPLTYTWAQVSGGLFLTIDSHTPSLTLNTKGADINGDTLVLSLSVDDGINAPVVSQVTIEIPAVDQTSLLSDRNLLQTSVWGETLDARNQDSTFSAFSGTLKSDFFLVRGWAHGVDYTSPFTVLQTDSSGNVIRKIFSQEPIVSSWTLATGMVLILTETHLKWFYSGLVDTDSPKGSILLTDHLPGADLTDLWACQKGSTMVAAIASNHGVLALQWNQSTGILEDKLILNVATNMLYGSNNVMWVKGSPEVVSLRSGHLFVGSYDGDTYESLIQLRPRKLLKIWDSKDTINKWAITGAFLREP